MFVRVPAIEGIPQIGSRHLYVGVSISPDEAVIHVEGDKIEKGWTKITEEEFRQYIPLQIVPEFQQETIEQKLERIETQNLLIMRALTDILDVTPGGEGRGMELCAALVETDSRMVKN